MCVRISLWVTSKQYSTHSRNWASFALPACHEPFHIWNLCLGYCLRHFCIQIKSVSLKSPNLTRIFSIIVFTGGAIWTRDVISLE